MWFIFWFIFGLFRCLADCLTRIFTDPARIYSRKSCGSTFLFLFPSENILVDRLCDMPAQTLASDVVSAKVLPCVNATQSRFLRRRGEASEMARHSCQRFGRDIEGKLIAEVKAQHGRARFTDCAMSSRVGRVGSGLRA